MDETKQRIAIAEACGFSKVKTVGWSGVFGDARKDVPDYLHDLNAMNEAEKMLTPRNFTAYAENILPLVDKMFGAWPVGGIHANEAFRVAHATASQRAESFLRTLNLCTE